MLNSSITFDFSFARSQATLAPILKFQEKVPQFKIQTHDLDDEVEYRFQVSAFNAKGSSDPFYILNHVKVYKNNSENGKQIKRQAQCL